VPDQDNVGRPCLQPYLDKGYVPHGSTNSVGNVCDQTVSRSLLYMQSDAAVATAATFLGKEEDSAVLAARAGNYSLLFDQETGFFRPREHGSGKFVVPFDEFAWGGDYTEAGPWQYVLCYTIVLPYLSCLYLSIYYRLLVYIL
jgi:putative alpha-1,2-mannosidase